MTNETRTATKGPPCKSIGENFLWEHSLNFLTTLGYVHSWFLLWLLFGLDFEVIGKTNPPVFTGVLQGFGRKKDFGTKEYYYSLKATVSGSVPQHEVE